MKNNKFSLLSFLALIILGLSNSSTFAADIYIHGKSTIHIDGKIVSGDAERLAILMSKMPGVAYFRVNSEGGNVEEATKMASLIEGTHAPLSVRNGGICASACFFLYIGAHQRSANAFQGDDGQNPSPEMLAKGRRFVGIHRPYLGSPIEVGKSSMQKQEKVMNDVRKYLKEKNTPQYLIDEMMGRPSNQVYWLREKDIDILGEFSAGLEEIYIKECGYNKREIYRSWTDKQIQNFTDCTIKVWEREMYPAQIVFLLRLETGWRPWNRN